MYLDHFHIDGGQWKIVRLTSSAEDIHFSCCPRPFSSITYHIILSRYSQFYVIYVILPLIALAFLFLVVFHMPPNNAERMGFGVTILLSITVYLLVLSNTLPEKSDDVPMIGIIFVVVLYLLCLGLCLAAATTFLSQKQTKPPAFIKRFTSNIICCSTKKSGSKYCHGEETKIIELANRMEHDGRDTVIINSIDSNGKNVSNNNSGSSNTSYNTGIADEINFNDEWIQISRFLDRRLFVIFLFLLILLPVIVVLSLPRAGLS